MKLYKKIFISVVIILTGLFISSISTQAAPVQQPDFRDDRIAAEEWAHSNYSDWRNKLSATEINAINTLNESDPSTNINVNRELEMLGGNLNNRPTDASIPTKRYKDVVSNIDKAINRVGTRLDDSLVVYRNDSTYDIIGMYDHEIKNTDGSINREFISKLKESWKNGLSRSFMKVDIAEDSRKSEGIIHWRISLPKGTKTGHINGNEIFLERDVGVLITDIRIITRRGSEAIRVEARLVPKEHVINQQQNVLENLNKDINRILGLSSGTQFLNFELHSLGSSTVSNNVRELLRDFSTQIHNTVIEKTIKFLKKGGGHLVFTDIPLTSIPKVYFPQPPKESVLSLYREATGVTNKYNKTIFINSLESFFVGSNKIKTNDLVHEFGHAFDLYIGMYELGIKDSLISDSEEFKNIFKEESPKLANMYARTNQNEFFAEVFRMINSDRADYKESLLTKAPRAFDFIKKRIDRTIDQ
ncbi:anthrax toxin lethal factor-related metalloendopeptidase [Enterococcus sp. 5H]|uniref:anthrax toxin lethal factor-related metalloendopeptidase n=1 Tax=Enterococcus sp. 5H TaxID=1229490 RepID=UPI0023040813|nr:ADP-ribosyltransferase [Enterococcus sp. 5H]